MTKLQRDMLLRRRSKPSPPTNGFWPTTLHEWSLVSCCRLFASSLISSSLPCPTARPELATVALGPLTNGQVAEADHLHLRSVRLRRPPGHIHSPALSPVTVAAGGLPPANGTGSRPKVTLSHSVSTARPTLLARGLPLRTRLSGGQLPRSNMPPDALAPPPRPTSASRGVRGSGDGDRMTPSR